MSAPTKASKVAAIRARLGADAPDWLLILAEEVDRSSQVKAARRIKYSAATVNYVLGGTYGGDLRKIESAVRGALMGATVDCPVLGTLETHRCLEQQRLPFNPSHPQRVRLYQACKACPNKRTTTTEPEGDTTDAEP